MGWLIHCVVNLNSFDKVETLCGDRKIIPISHQTLFENSCAMLL